MYDWPEIRAITDNWWKALASAFLDEGVSGLPANLHRGGSDGETWTDPNLLLSQTCGYPFTHGGSQHLRLVATPCYGVEGCEGPNYRSLIVCRADAEQNHVREFRGLRGVINDLMSQSGYSALRAVIAPHAEGRAFFSQVLTSGGHRFSMEMVSTGKADISAIDPVSFALAKRYVPELCATLKVIGTSPDAPGLPYVTHKNVSDKRVEQLRRGLNRAIREPEFADIRKTLFIADVQVVEAQAYDRILEIEQAAVVLGYPNVA
jgi:ABC-type phosphate/phosphonate transport system substrate-binding protein